MCDTYATNNATPLTIQHLQYLLTMCNTYVTNNTALLSNTTLTILTIEDTYATNNLACDTRYGIGMLCQTEAGEQQID